MRSQTTTVSLLLAIVAFCGLASATDYYVDVNTGDDANGGTS